MAVARMGPREAVCRRKQVRDEAESCWPAADASKARVDGSTRQPAGAVTRISPEAFWTEVFSTSSSLRGACAGSTYTGSVNSTETGGTIASGRSSPPRAWST